MSFHHWPNSSGVKLDVVGNLYFGGMEWSIQQIARLASTTSRTLRHYDDLDLVPPSRIGSNGYRYYDELALRRLQRVLLLRGLGLGLPQIAEILTEQSDEASALTTHLSLLRQEQDRLGRQIAAVEHTLATLQGGADLSPAAMFDGFDHTQYKDEVEQRWGKEAYARADGWWRALSGEERREWTARASELAQDWVAAARAPQVSPGSPAAQRLAHRHLEWLQGMPGTPMIESGSDVLAYVRGVAETYVADERFAATYGGLKGESFVREALLTYVENSERM